MSNKIYQIITDNIISKLEEGIVPWRKPWNAHAPTSLSSMKPYRGINAFILGMAPYSSPYWLTYKQAKKLNGNVITGSKGTAIVFWKWIEKKGDDGKVNKFPFLRYFNVFNVQQCENLDLSKIPTLAESDKKEEFTSIECCENIVEGYENKPPIVHDGHAAFYTPSKDQITMPPQDDFHSPEEYYCTLFHEMGHSTGAKNRLNREGVAGMHFFGSHEYSKEELIAEMTAAFLCGHCEITQPFDNSVSYIQSWLKQLKKDIKLVVLAAAAAQKAADHILGIKFDNKED